MRPLVRAVEPGEERAASLLAGHSFAMGLATVSFETAASALFLARYGAAALPWVYLAAALLTVATGAAFTALQPRVRFHRLMTGTVVLLAASVVVLRAALEADLAWLPFALLVWYRAISILTDLEYWAVAGRILDVRQAKRLFPLVGAGEVVARIAGSFAVPVVVGLLGVKELLSVSAASLLACAGLAAAVLAGSPTSADAPRAPRRDEPRAALRVRLGGLFRDRYLLLLVGIAALAVLAKYLVDFSFLEQLRARHGDAARLATFFALFSGLTQALSLLVRVTVAGPLLRRYGLRAGLLVLPAAHAACTLAIVALGLLPADGALLFWLVVANQGLYKVLKHPIDTPSFKVLYQPLRKDRRLAAQVAVETLVTPLTIGVAGGLMLLFSRGLPYHPAVFAWVLLAGFAAWAVLAARAGRAYAAALLDALRGRIVDDGPFTYGDAKSRAVLLQALDSERPSDVLFALDLMEKAALLELEGALGRMADHASPEVRRSALLRLQRLGFASGLAAGERHAGPSEPSAAVRAAALRTLCARLGLDAWPRVAPFLRDPSPEVRRGALTGLLQAGSHEAFRQLVLLSGAAEDGERAAAARVIGELAQGGFHGPLRWLLCDPDRGVRRAALQAAGRVRQPELWPAVARALGERGLDTAAVTALSAGGEAAIPALAAAAGAGSGPVLRAAAAVCARVRGPRAVTLLLEWIEWPDPRTRTEVLRALVAAGFRAEDESRPALMARLRTEAQEATWLSAVLRDLGEGADLAVLRSAVEEALDAARDRVLLALALLYDAGAMARARDGLRATERDRRAYALEVLDVTLPPAARALVLPLLEAGPPARRVERLGEHLPQETKSPAGRVAELLGDAAPVSEWTRACAQYVADAAGAIGRGEMARRGGPMLTIEKVLYLKAVDMFAGATEEVLADVAGILVERTARAGETILRKGEAGDGMYVIVDGRVRVFDGERTITHLGDRDIFGELALLDPEPRVASIEAVEDTRLFHLDREAFSELMAGNIDVVRGVLHVLCERLRAASAGPSYPGAGQRG